MGRVYDGNDQVAAVFPTTRYLSSVTHAVRRVEEKLAPAQKRQARKLLARFFDLCEDNRADIDYSQHRPFRVAVTPDGFVGDCSSYPTQAFAWVNRELARLKAGFLLRDPNGVVEFDGYGYTGTTLQTNHGHRIPLDHKFFVGDIAIFGQSMFDTRHEMVCKLNGNASTARWSSHGSARGPRPEPLSYRNDLLGVYRPVSLL